MNWKRLRCWLLRATLGCLAGLLCATGTVWYIIHTTEKERWLVSEEGRLATALGWERTDDVEERLRVQPMLVLSLMEHDSLRVRRAAQLFLRVRNPKLDEATLDAIVAEIRDPEGTEREFLVELLSNQGAGGAARIASFYRSAETPSESLQRAIEHALQPMFYLPRDELIRALIGVVCDETVPLDNRGQAATALGYMGMPDIRHEPSDGRFAAVATLQELSRSLPRPVAETITAALQRIEAARARRESALAPQESTLEFQHLSAEGTEAIVALADQKDWSRVGGAADALARHGITQAIPELEKVAASHWYRPVRRMAQRAVSVLQGREPYLPTVDEQGRFKTPLMDFRWQLEREIDEWQNGPRHTRYEDGSWSSGRNLRRTLRVWHGCILPRVREVEYRRPGRLTKRLALEDVVLGRPWPEYATSFGGGTLRSYNAGEWGCGLVYCQKGRTPQLIAPLNATDFIRMPFGLLILTFGEGVLVAKTNAEGSVDIAPFPKQLPLGFGTVAPPRMQPNGELKAECIGADVYITPTGDVRFVDRSAG